MTCPLVKDMSKRIVKCAAHINTISAVRQRFVKYFSAQLSNVSRYLLEVRRFALAKRAHNIVVVYHDQVTANLWLCKDYSVQLFDWG